jgi:hypothetical protein
MDVAAKAVVRRRKRQQVLRTALPRPVVRRQKRSEIRHPLFKRMRLGAAAEGVACGGGGGRLTDRRVPRTWVCLRDVADVFEEVELAVFSKKISTANARAAVAAAAVAAVAVDVAEGDVGAFEVVNVLLVIGNGAWEGGGGWD